MRCSEVKKDDFIIRAGIARVDSLLLARPHKDGGGVTFTYLMFRDDTGKLFVGTGASVFSVFKDEPDFNRMRRANDSELKALLAEFDKKELKKDLDYLTQDKKIPLKLKKKLLSLHT